MASSQWLNNATCQLIMAVGKTASGIQLIIILIMTDMSCLVSWVALARFVKYIETRYTECTFIITLGGRARFDHPIRVFGCMTPYTKSAMAVTPRPRYKSQLRTHLRTTDSTCFSSRPTQSTHSTKVSHIWYYRSLLAHFLYMLNTFVKMLNISVVGPTVRSRS